MKFVIEPEGGRLHWIVKCQEKGRLVELHRFYRSADKFVYHRGDHGEHEGAAQKALLEFFAANPGAGAAVPELQPGENSTMDVRRKAAGGGKRDKKEA